MVATEFILVLFLAGFGLVAGLPMIVLPLLFAPKKPNPIKSQTFESGQLPAGESKVHLIMQYYAYLIMFVVFRILSYITKIVYGLGRSPGMITLCAP